MCGIIGAVAQRNVVPILLEGLKRLEYRGYDSAGLAVINEGNILSNIKVQGKVAELIKRIQKDPVTGQVGIAHTRWATHGKPSVLNAHPHTADNIAIVHNGIIENYQNLKQELIAKNIQFETDTDSEVISKLIAYYYQQENDLKKAVHKIRSKLKGAYAIAVIAADLPNEMITLRHGSPIVIGVGLGEHFVASDKIALKPVTQKFITLEEGDLAHLKQNNLQIYNHKLKVVQRKSVICSSDTEEVSKGSFKHFMLKEIFEQPKVMQQVLANRLNDTELLVESFGSDAPDTFAKVSSVHIVACGTSFHAGLIAKSWIESYTNIPCVAEVASEYRYRANCVSENTLLVTISQSGETADTLQALRAFKSQFLTTLSICNVAESALVHESDLVLLTHAGPEIGVASTKAFTSQLVALLMLTESLRITHENKNIPVAEPLQKIGSQLSALPEIIEQILELNTQIKTLAEKFVDKQHALFLGRGSMYPVAKEGALKLKEISYIHAEAYPAGELKHGPLALIDKHMPVVAVAPNNYLLEKICANLAEVSARGGQLFVFADEKARKILPENAHLITVPSIPEILSPIIYTVPLQLLAYHVAVLRGTDVDQPRNLAKSVTVE